MKKVPSAAKRLVRAIGFWMLFLCMLCILSYVLRPYSGSTSRKNLCGFYAEEKNSLDVVFIGSSSCFAFWEPMEFWKKYGITSYNFATGAMPVQCELYAIKEVLKTQSPELLVIDMRLYTFAERYYYEDKSIVNTLQEVPLRNFADNLKYSWNRFEFIKNKVPDFYDKEPFYIDIMKYHTEWPRLFDKQSILFALNSASDYMKGFYTVPSVKRVKHEDGSMIEDVTPLSSMLDEELHELLDFCKENELQVQFLANAYCRGAADWKTFNYIESVVQEYGYDFLDTEDYAEEMGLDYKTDYYDSSHTNILGAEKYTEFVGNYLMEHYDLKPNHEEAVDHAWKVDYELWEEEIQSVKEEVQAEIQRLEKKYEKE